MDVTKITAVRTRLQDLEETRSWAIRAATERGLIRPTVDDVEKRLRDLADYTLEMESILRDLIEAIDSTPTG